MLIPWVYRYRVRNYLRDSIWVVPVFGIVAALIAVRLMDALERAIGAETGMNPEGARAVLGALASSTFTFIVFVSSTLLLAVQLASAQLTPRIIGFLFRDRMIKFALAAFVFTFTFTLAALVRIGTSVPPFTAKIAAYGSIVNLGIFVYLIDHVGRSLRANGALRSIGALGQQIIELVYPRLADASDSSLSPEVLPTGEPADAIDTHRGGAILAFDAAGLATLADRCGCTIEIVPHVGDVVAVGDLLFRVFRKGGALPAGDLRRFVAIGPERTFEQDPGLALRIIVDIACKALSPAINDPSTAVAALDQLHHLLRSIGIRRLDEGVWRGPSGQCRLLYHTPDWASFVNLAITEIRHFGGESIQVARRLRALLEDLIRTLPEERAVPLRQELALLRRSGKRFFTDPEDQALAEVSDPQGVGSRQQDSTYVPAETPK